MAKRKPIDASLLNNLVQASQNQDPEIGVSRSTDPNHPVFATPINEDILVYIPRTNVRTLENSEVMDMLKAFLHDAKIGKRFMQLRSVANLSGEFFEKLGYDGTCPINEAMQDVWELYRFKFDLACRQAGINPETATKETLSPIKRAIMEELPLKPHEEYVTFPIVRIKRHDLAATDAKVKMFPAADALEHLRVEYVVWRKDRFEKCLMKPLEELEEQQDHPAGLFWLWKFTYNVPAGQAANAMMSAKDATYSVITNSKALAELKPLTPELEKAAESFTLLKAQEVVVANQFMYRDELEAEIATIMAPVYQQLDILRAQEQGNVQIAAGAGAVAPNGTANPLATFGATQEATPGVEAPITAGGGTVTAPAGDLGQEAAASNPVTMD